MFQSVFEWRHAELFLEDIDEVLGSHKSNVRRQLTHINISALQQNAGVFQSHVSHEFCWCFACKAAYTVEERYTSHSHGIGHLFQTNLSAAHIL